MQLLKFSLLFIFSMSQAFAITKAFNTRDCLESRFQLKISHSSALFGLIKNKLQINKDECIIELKHKKFTETKWVFDVCREPIHIKYHDKGQIEVIKRSQKCQESGNLDEFCKTMTNILNIIQDDGLIFAEGSRELISSDHGKAWCAYLLVKNYAMKSNVFSILNSGNINIFEGEGILTGKDNSNCDLKSPEKSEVGAKIMSGEENKVPKDDVNTPQGQF